MPGWSSTEAGQGVAGRPGGHPSKPGNTVRRQECIRCPQGSPTGAGWIKVEQGSARGVTLGDVKRLQARGWTSR